jgi:hypothetical protein
MKLTLDEVIQRINQVLNYPSVSYEDVYHFFDHAIAELDTILKVDIPSVSAMLIEFKDRLKTEGTTVLLSATPTNLAFDANYIAVFDESPDGSPDSLGIRGFAYVRNSGFYTYSPNFKIWKRVPTLYGEVPTSPNEFYKAYYDLNSDSAIWVKSEFKGELDLCDYMPADWWTLFVIPYVCFKFAVRDGDDGALYSTEFTQGLQQLQTSYDVPNSVVLSTVADLPAYRALVLSNIDNLNTKVVPRAITNRMRVGNAVPAIFGNMYSTGGWGI